MPETSDVGAVEATRTARFARFLRSAVAVKTKPVTEVQRYPTVEWFSKMPIGFDQVRSPLFTPNWPADDLRWLTVARVTEPERPAAPDNCAPWLVGVELDSPALAPALNAYYEEKREYGEIVQVASTPDARAAWDAYLSRHWNNWAAKASVSRAVKPLYQRLFGIHQELQGRADAFDLFVGVGLLDSRVEPTQRLRRHLFAFSAELVLDERTGVISLGPSADFVSLRPETDFLPSADRARLHPQEERLREELAAVGPALQDRNTVGDLLTRLATSLSAEADYVDDLSPADALAGGSRVSFAPALILRPRSTRSLDALLARIEADASGPAPKVPLHDMPVAWRKMMEDGQVWGGRVTSRSAGPAEQDGRVFFPLPSNDEQSRIIRFANGSAGVVVQGPPGTGKSHTIANLISHYLAIGQRVLVTAQTAQALEVLRDKVPAELQQLCISLLGDSRASDRDLKRSVEGILSRQLDFDPAQYQTRIATLDKDLLASETRLNDLDRTLHHARAAETQELEPIPGYRGTRAGIARRLRDERERFDWLQDKLPHQTPCPAYVFGWERLADYHQALDAAMRTTLDYEWPALPFTRDSATELIDEIDSAKEALGEGTAPTTVPALPPDLDKSSLVAADKWLTELQSIEHVIAADDSVWSGEVRTGLMRGLATWHSLLEECSETLATLTDGTVGQIRSVAVEGRSATEARRDLTTLDNYYAAGGRKRHLFVFKPALVKDTEWVETAVAVEGLPLRTPEDVTRARRALDGLAQLDSAWRLWARWPSARHGSPRAQVAALRQRAVLLRELLKAATAAAGLGRELRPWLDQALSGGSTTAEMLWLVKRRLDELTLGEARARRDELVERLRQAIANRNVLPAIRALLDALTAEDSERVADSYRHLDEELLRRDAHRHYLEFLTQLRTSAPLLAKAIVADEGTDSWVARFMEFEAAWKHQCVRSWLDVVLSKEKIEATHRAARDERQRGQETLRSLAAARAWAGALARVDDQRRASLVAWARAVANIPATGLSVFRKRAAAQRLLGQCLDTIPAWVVSLGRLYETVEAEPGLFDVAIIDEASQCWLDSLVLFYLAKQVIVVGDDKQISPTLVGVRGGDIDRLADTYLQDFKFRSSFTQESSLFDHARLYLSAGVPLREHFRCVPEIIRFSNELCYQGNPLIPLRQVGRNRLEPLKRTYLPQGLRSGDVNEMEAMAVVDAVAKCHEDPAYEEADFGVICLQGDMQGARIEQLLLDRLGPAVFSERRLRCGNPYAFQGDERDVIFMSMVAAPNVHQQSLTIQMYQQRFNVAMSRARDQVWLFHSIQEDELGNECLRRKVIQFFRQPQDQTIHGSSLDVPALQLRAARADRSVQKAPVPFDSWFEVDVALALVAQGYALSAQVQVAKRRIDLVIEGDEGVRLAVECDGEAWHGVEQYESDVARQRQLERAGWTFVRVRESLFYSDQGKAIEEIVAACGELEIAPGNARPLKAAAVPYAGRPVPVPAPVCQRIADGAVISAPEGTWRDETAELELANSHGEDTDAEESVVEDRPTDSAAAANGFRSGPFTGYSSRSFPDPRTAPLANVRDVVLEIVTADGPLPKESVYRLYRDGCRRVERAGKHLRQAVNRALFSLERSGLVVSRDEGKRRLPPDVVVLLPSQDASQQRPAGARKIDDVPLSELAAVMTSLRGAVGPSSTSDQASLYREVGERYGIRRLTVSVVQRLRRAEAFAYPDSPPGQASLL